MACDKAAIEKEIKQCFDAVDTDKSGFIESGEVEALFLQIYQRKGNTANPKTKGAVEAFVKELDTNKDGKVSLQEFSDFAVKVMCP